MNKKSNPLLNKKSAHLAGKKSNPLLNKKSAHLAGKKSSPLLGKKSNPLLGKKLSSYKSGLLAEWISKQFLRIHGFKIIESRYVTGKNTNRAEIDIIAKRADLIIFVEVKKRPDVAQGIESVTYTQAKRLRNAAEGYIIRKSWAGGARFDLIIVSGFKIHWLKQII